MRITAIQMSPTSVVEDNIEQTQALIERACEADRPDFVVLPEMWSCLGGDASIKRYSAEALPGLGGNGSTGPLYSFLSETARRHRVTLHGGSIGELAGGALCNTTLVFSPDGGELARYRKIHLFDVVTPNGDRYCESDTYRAGERPVTFRLGDTIVGCVICYDLRFGYLFDVLREAGSTLIAVPAAFTMETGQAHWSVLLRARAIETQSWIAAAGTTGDFLDADGKVRSTYGHSMICDPWGRVVAEAGREPGWVTATMDQAVTERVRNAMPVWQHRQTLAGMSDART